MSITENPALSNASGALGTWRRMITSPSGSTRLEMDAALMITPDDALS